MPQVMTASHLTLDGEKIDIKEMNTPNAYLWAPSIKTAFGGVPVYSGVHVWMADSQSKAARSNWNQGAEQPAGPETRSAWCRVTSWGLRPRVPKP